MYKCTNPKCRMTVSDDQMESKVERGGSKLYCKECGYPVEHVEEAPKQNGARQGAQAILNSNADNSIYQGDNSGNRTTINIHNGQDIDEISKAFGRVQEQTVESLMKFMKEAASHVNRNETSFIGNRGEIDKGNACTCKSCGKLVPSQHYDHQQHLCVDCLYKKAAKLMEKDLWDDAVDEFKRVEMISTAEMLPEVQEAIGTCYYMDDDKKKAKKYLALAETPISYYVLGYCFLGEDTNQAIRNFTKAAEKDVQPAQEWLKDYYLKEDNNLGKAEVWLLRLAKAGDLLSQFQLANVYLIYADAQKQKNKNATQENYRKAAEWLEKVAHKGIDIALYQLGNLLLKGDGVTKNTTRAIELMTQAGESGFIASQFDLASIFEKGKYGIEADDEKSLYWYKKVAEQKQDQDIVVVAMYKVGLFYLEGKGTGRNYQEAANWLKKAALKNHVQAQVALGKTYKNKLSNLEEAVNWLSKASKAGDIEAKYELGTLYLTQSATKPERKLEATALLTTAADNGHVEAMMAIAQRHEEDGFYALAKDYYQKAAGKGSKQAQGIIDERFSGKTFAEKWRKFIGSPAWGTIGSGLSKLKGCLPLIIGAVIILVTVNMCNKACRSCTGAGSPNSGIYKQDIFTEAEVDEPAHYPTGIQQLNKDIKALFKNNYNVYRSNQSLSGDFQLHFIITKEGRAIVDSKSIPIENKDVVRVMVEVMNRLPKQWQPAKKNSEYVNQYVDITLHF